MMMNGSLNDLNCATRIRNSRITERIKPMAKLWNAWRMLAIIPRTLIDMFDGIFVDETILSIATPAARKILAACLNVDVDHRPQLRVIDNDGCFGTPKVSDRVETNRFHLAGSVGAECFSDPQRSECGFPDIATVSK